MCLLLSYECVSVHVYMIPYILCWWTIRKWFETCRSTFFTKLYVSIQIAINDVINDDLPHDLYLFEYQRFYLSTFLKFICNYLDIQAKRYYCHQIWSRILDFDWHIYICPWPIVMVKVMHISTANISQTVSDIENILPSERKSDIGFWLTCTFDLDSFKRSRSCIFQM